MATLGLIVGNRGFFPSELCEEGRKRVLKVLAELGIDVVALTPEDTPFGTVESYEDAKKCAALFKANAGKLDGILVTLPNFGDERGVADTIRLSGLDVPVLVQAFPDEVDKMSVANRRDSFCGKISVCNNLRQYNIPFTLTELHTVAPEAESFKKDLLKFAAVCRVVKGLRKARFGQIGVRPVNFTTVRYSEKILEKHGIAVEPYDLAEILGQINRLKENDPAVKEKVAALRNYVATTGVAEDALTKMARFAVVLEDLIKEHEWDGTAIQCWTALEEYYGVVPCAVMSMLSEMKNPSACEADITGLIGMYALTLAADRPSALLDWNNNYGDDPDQGVVFHCSNLPQDVFGHEAVMDYQAIIAGTVGKENTYGTVTGRIKPAWFTYCRVTTDDTSGQIRAYTGEGRFTGDPLQTFGGYGVIKIPRLQRLLRYICENGFEHHVAICPGEVGAVINEAFSKYLKWDIYYHQ
ncbi:MAG TPA: fucose isomerase [Firmicutes bacterium]|jgi:L-fucose isomerase-like protein|nr:fucose isomerase [Bacillota bacterium]